jgi:hypothetical protein
LPEVRRAHELEHHVGAPAAGVLVHGGGELAVGTAVAPSERTCSRPRS